MSKLSINIENYGEVKLKLPKKFTREIVESLIAEAVGRALTLVASPDPDTRFHPVLGAGGYKRYPVTIKKDENNE